ncbi:MAG TPA: class IIb bacteriocin, lactobin A/cerein 7B family [Bacteroidales bacterium]|nr:class IIb bacteriocin, lactobin A/cerein 7B family [Bacteroidales bacterium]
MNKLTFKEMESVSGGDWLNNHTWRQHLICIGFGALAAAGGPLATAGTMALCYMSLD